MSEHILSWPADLTVERTVPFYQGLNEVEEDNEFIASMSMESYGSKGQQFDLMYDALYRLREREPIAKAVLDQVQRTGLLVDLKWQDPPLRNTSRTQVDYDALQRGVKANPGQWVLAFENEALSKVIRWRRGMYGFTPGEWDFRVHYVKAYGKNRGDIYIKYIGEQS